MWRIWLWATIVQLWSATAHTTPPPIRVSVEGQCPDATTLGEPIAQFTRTPEDDQAAYTLQVHSSEEGRIQVVLLSPRGELEFDRTLQSRDCVAVAEAVAIILRAHFVELGMHLPEPAVGRGDSPAEDDKSAVEDGSTSRPPVAQPEAPPPAPPAPARAPGTSPQGPEGAAVTEADSTRWELGAGMGALLELPEITPTPSLRLEVGRVVARRTLRASFVGALPTRRGDSPADVSRLPLSVAVNLGWRFGTGWLLEPHAGVGAQLALVEGVSVGNPSLTASWSPTLCAGARVEWPTAPLTPWVDVGGITLLRRDRYVVDPLGAVGLGPRAYLGVSVGASLLP